MKKIVLGLSDGVDSAVAATILKQEDYEVIGVYLKNAGETELAAAKRSAAELGIEFCALDIRAELSSHVCEPFINEYLRGRTPSPCPGCNRSVKLKALMDFADIHGIENVATGHYVLKRDDKLYMGQPDCDQSYMLALITPEQCGRLILPLGGMSKSHTRKLAAALNLSCANKPDSRENCFIRDMNYSEYIRKNRPNEIPFSGIVYFNGEPFDEHAGIYNYTVGQRWKSDYDGRRLYVSRILNDTNAIELCLWDDLFTREVDIGGISFIDGKPRSGEINARIRVRHTRWETPECVLTVNGTTAHAICNEPLRAPAPGQVCAIYKDNRLIGGGYVESVAADYPMQREVRREELGV